ncbi:MAG: UDP-N-acetylmuramoyl-tripeptide--D-alanyl-D-alanine ligase [Clostridia bacterium]|nr:UDP-N-acetylmuramoyl-tripeptide--D-alanyl-D-alanine ligase [Clostridia bacterium]
MAYQAARWMLCLASALICVAASKSLIHYFQLESYQFPGYFHTLNRNAKRAWLPGSIATAVLLALFTIFHAIGASAVWEIILALLVMTLAVCAGWVISLFVQDKKAKKPLVFTPRVKRLYGVYGILMGIIALLAGMNTPWVLILCFLPLLLPFWTALAGLLAWPIEKFISELYFRDAQRKLREMKGLIRIGITGSYGKTSVKFILGTLLEEKYNVLVTPASFNTPMGVTKVIREKLTPAHQVFVSEMGARHVGDIKEMCRLVHPHLGMLTSVGPQHLETFKSIDRIAKTKYELMDAIPNEGCCFFSDDAGICRSLYEKTQKTKKLASMKTDARPDVWAQNVSVGPQGSQFELHTADESIECRTRLLGEHNIQNILLAVSVCLHLGMDLETIARGIGKLKPVEHRLQLIPTGIGMTIIDDAFNSNPKGASAALKVMAGFLGRRIIITPGMVELGEKEAQYNHEFGREMAHSVDLAILVGKKHTKPIMDGLLEAGFDSAAIHQVNSLDESTQYLHQIMRSGDVVLYENDLPDNYSEG